MDQVTNRATDAKRIEKKSALKLIDSLMVSIVVQCQLVIMNSVL